MAIKKIATKTSATKTLVTPEENTSTDNTTGNTSFIQKNKLPLIVLTSAIVILGGLYIAKSLFVAATVNGEPISRFTIIQELEKQGGKQTMGSIITKTLIFQEAKKQNITVSQKEIDDEIKKTEEQFTKQGQKLDDVLLASGLTRKGLEEQMKINTLVEKLIGKDITVSSKEVKDYLEANKDSIPPNANTAELEKTVKEQLRQQKLKTKFDSWIMELQSKANINYFVQY